MSPIHPAVMRLGLKQLIGTKKFLFAALVSLVPLVAGMLMFIDDLQDADEEGNVYSAAFTEPTGFMIVLATVPFVTLMLAGGHLADEAEDRTLTYLLVRPVPRSTLYLSRYVPVAAAAALLAILQVVLLALMRLLAYAFAGGGEEVVAEEGTETYDVALLVLGLVPGHAFVVALEALVFTALFGLVSLVTTRFHFFVNLVIVLLDVAFGTLGGGGFGVLTVSYWVMSWLGGTDPTTPHMVGSAAAWPLVPFWLLAWVALWLWLGVRQVRRRDFNITSAAT